MINVSRDGSSAPYYIAACPHMGAEGPSLVANFVVEESGSRIILVDGCPLPERVQEARQALTVRTNPCIENALAALATKAIDIMESEATGIIKYWYPILHKIASVFDEQCQVKQVLEPILYAFQVIQALMIQTHTPLLLFDMDVLTALEPLADTLPPCEILEAARGASTSQRPAPPHGPPHEQSVAVPTPPQLSETYFLMDLLFQKTICNSDF